MYRLLSLEAPLVVTRALSHCLCVVFVWLLVTVSALEARVRKLFRDRASVTHQSTAAASSSASPSNEDGSLGIEFDSIFRKLASA